MRAAVAGACCLLLCCASREVPTGPATPPPEVTAAPSSQSRSFHLGDYVFLSAPGKDGSSIALIGGKRARLHADGRVELELVAAPEPLIGFIEVPGKAGSTWIGASKHGVFRFADPLGAAVLIHQSSARIDRVAAVPGAAALWLEGADRWASIDAESGKLLQDITLGGALPAELIAFDSALHGLAMAGSYRFETQDGGASWHFLPADRHDVEVIYGVARERGDWRRNTTLEERLKTAPLTVRFMVELGEDPLAAAASRGVRAPAGTAVVNGKDDFGLALVSLSTGAVLASTAMVVRGDCEPFEMGGDAVGVACDNGSVYPLEIGDHSLIVGQGRASGSTGKLIAAAGDGIAYDKACNSTADDGSLCVRQANGMFETISLPPAILRKSIRPNGDVLGARRDGDVIVVERHSPHAAPVRLGEWRGCPDAASVGIDELEGGGFRLVGPVACAGDIPQYGMFTKIAGAETTEPLHGALTYRMGGGRVAVRAAREVRVMSRPDVGWQRTSIAEGRDVRLSTVGFVAGELAHLGWDGRFQSISESAQSQPMRLPKLACKTGSVIGKGGSPLYQPPFRGQFVPRSADKLDTFVGLTTVKGDWLVQWLDTWDLGGTVHELRMEAPAKGDAWVSAVAVRGDSIVATVSLRGGDGKDQAWAVRRFGGGAIERESIPFSTPRDMVLGRDGTAAWAAGGAGVVWPLARPKLEFIFPEMDSLTLAADGGRAYLFAPRNTLESVVEVKGPLARPGPDGLDASLFATAIPRWRDRSRSLVACDSATTGGRLVRVVLSAVLEIDGQVSPKSDIEAELSWQPGQTPCIARMRALAEKPDIAIVKVDLAASRAESLDLVRGDTKELACRWESSTGATK